MKLIDLTLESAAANIALDEAILDLAESEYSESRQVTDGYLRLWTPDSYAVVMGRSCKANDEVNLEFCQQHKIPVIRRSSGGGTIITGPGCLMYAVVIGYQDKNELRMIDRAHDYVLTRMRRSLESIQIESDAKGQSDLALGQLKFSGNAMRCKRHHFLYHGTLLCDFDLTIIPKALKQPPRQPDYRNDRTHQNFVINLGIDEETVRNALISQWNAVSDNERLELSTDTLVLEKYGQDQWNFKH